jgi:hypothetical protein
VVQLLGLIYRKQFAAAEAPETGVSADGVVVFEEAYFYG